MNITRLGSQPARPGPADYFTGRVRLESPFSGNGGFNAASVSFEPGARTNWHTHPLGQTILITAGLGLVQRAGDAAQQVRAGDLVFFAPGERHWHGAGPDCGMTHLAIAETADGGSVDWLEPVSDAEYAAAITG